MISEYSKLAQKKYKTSHDKVGKVVHRKLCNSLTFDYRLTIDLYTIKLCRHKTESIQENEMHYYDTNR